MRYLSLFSGIEAASVAWETLGWEPVAFAEVEPFPCAVLAERFPNVPNLGDVTKFKEWPDVCLCDGVFGIRRDETSGASSDFGGVGGEASNGDLSSVFPAGESNRAVGEERTAGSGMERGTQLHAELNGSSRSSICTECGGFNGPIELIVGGSPCQSFSVAGLRKGLDDPRGNLALTYLGIVEKYKPEWVVWENVPGVLSSGGGRDFGSFLGALAQLGYGFAYRILDAQYVRTPDYPRAVPQRRRRVFVVGNLRDARRAATVLFDSESVLGNPPPSRQARKDASSDAREGVEGNGGGIIHASEVSTVDAQNKVDRGDTQHAERMIVQPQWWDGGDSAASLTTRCHDQSMPDKGNFAAIVEPTAFKIRGGSETETGEQGGTPGRKAGKGYLGSEEVTFTIASSQDQHVFYQTQNEVAGTLDASYHKGCGERGGVEREYIAYENHANDSRIKQLDDDVSPSVVARWGTGGNNQALVQKVYESKQHHNPQPTENVSLTTTNCATIRGDSVIVQTLPLNTMTMQGRPSDEGRMGSGIGDPDDPAPTLSKQHSHAVAIRTANTNANGHGIADEVTHTLDQTNSNAVAYGVDLYNLKVDSDIAVSVTSRSGIPDATGPRLMSTAYAVDVYNQTIDGDVTATLTEACGGTNTSGPKVMAFEPGSIARNAGPAGEDVVCPTLRKEMGDNQPAVRIEVAPSLTAANNPSRSPQSSEVTQQVGAVYSSSMQVRRLTPKECERLQGFPDDWTRIPWRKKGAEDCPDGPRYKAIGNSMAVNVMQWIGIRIKLVKEMF